MHYILIVEYTRDINARYALGEDCNGWHIDNCHFWKTTISNFSLSTLIHHIKRTPLRENMSKGL